MKKIIYSKNIYTNLTEFVENIYSYYYKCY